MTFLKFLRFLQISVQGCKYKIPTKKLHLISAPISFYEEASTCMNFKIWTKEASTSTCFLYPDFLHLLPYPEEAWQGMCSLVEWENLDKGSKYIKISIKEASDNLQKKYIQTSNFHLLKLIFGSGLDPKKLCINQYEDLVRKIAWL